MRDTVSGIAVVILGFLTALLFAMPVAFVIGGGVADVVDMAIYPALLLAIVTFAVLLVLECW